MFFTLIASKSGPGLLHHKLKMEIVVGDAQPVKMSALELQVSTPAFVAKSTTLNGIEMKFPTVVVSCVERSALALIVLIPATSCVIQDLAHHVLPM